MPSLTLRAHSRTIETLTRHLSLLYRGFSTVYKMSHPSEERYSYNPTLHWNPQVEEYFIKAYGPARFSRISKALTRPSCYSCVRVNVLKTTVDAIIEKLLKIHSDSGNQNLTHKYTARDEREVNDIDLGSFEGDLRGELVYKCPIPGLDYVVFVQGTGPHEIEYQHALGEPLKEVIVSRKCAEAVLRGAQIYVPGVLACSLHVEKGDMVAVSVAVEKPQPDGKWGTGITRGTVLNGSETDPLYSEREGLYIGKGRTMMSRAGIFRVLEGVAICMNNRVFDLPSFNNVLESEIFLQNLPSIVAAHVLDPRKSDRILDMCAAPGGKTTAIAMLMKDEGEVIAVDRSHNKVLEIQKLASELGLKSIITYKLDALKSVSRHDAEHDPNSHIQKELNSSNSNDEQVSKSNKNFNHRIKNGPGKNQVNGARVEKSKGFPPNSFDRVLLDAPCSALGLRPRLLAGEETIESLRSHGKYQKRMLDQAVQLVRTGGVLVYSTCTINPGENEAVVRYALDTYKFLSLVPQEPRVGGQGLVGCCKFSNGYVEEWLRPGEEELVQRFDPSKHGTIGFFIAKFLVGPKDGFEHDVGSASNGR